MQAVLLAAVNSGNRKTWQILLPTFRFGSNISVLFFSSLFFGYSFGSSPVVGYHYGARNEEELKNMFQKSLTIVLCAGGVMTLSGELFASPLTAVFTGYDAALFEMTRDGFRIYALAFVLLGVCIWSSGFFTALGDGGVSAVISFLRTFLFQITAVLVLPELLGIRGIWMAVLTADLMAVAVITVFLLKKRKIYRYF